MTTENKITGFFENMCQLLDIDISCYIYDWEHKQHFTETATPEEYKKITKMIVHKLIKRTEITSELKHNFDLIIKDAVNYASEKCEEIISTKDEKTLKDFLLIRDIQKILNIQYQEQLTDKFLNGENLSTEERNTLFDIAQSYGYKPTTG